MDEEKRERYLLSKEWPSTRIHEGEDA